MKLGKKVLFLGDLHGGSNVGMSTDEMYNEDGNLIHQNSVQKAISKQFYKMIDDVGRVDLLVLNGDMVEGVNYAEDGVGNWTNDMDIQVANISDVIKDIKFRRCVGTTGSRYHTGSNPTNDKRVVERVGGTYMKEISNTINGVRIYATHKAMCHKNKQTRPSAITMSMVASEINSMDFGKCDIIVHNHTHQYAAVDLGKCIGFLGPCYKGRDDFAIKSVSPLSFNPSIGYILVDIDTDGTFSWYKDIITLKGNLAMKTIDILELPTRDQVGSSYIRRYDND